MIRTKFVPGHVPDSVDKRDHILAMPNPTASILSIDLRLSMPPIWDQGVMGSCTANAAAAAIWYDQVRQNLQPFIASRLFMYWQARNIEGTTNLDVGCNLRDLLKGLNQIGVPPESEWPYDSNLLFQKPTPTAVVDGGIHKATAYLSINQDLPTLKSTLQAGMPFLFGIAVFSSMLTDAVYTTGDIPLPLPDETYLGGHAMLAVGYNDNSQRFIVRNSFGTAWGGNGGYGSIPYEYMTSPALSNSFWVIQSMEAPPPPPRKPWWMFW